MDNININMLHIGFIGFGLIGGSIARVLKQKYPDCTISVYSRSPEPVCEAVNDGIVNNALTSVDTTFSQCDFIFLCTPVEYSKDYLIQLKPLINSHCIITDVGSVKGYIHTIVTELDMENNFIGGHPMAGSEKTGYANSSAYLLENAYYAITPTKSTKDNYLYRYVSLVESMGAIPIVIDYKEHDYSVAGISHIPHLIASSLVNLVRESDNSDELMKMLAAGGFKDITRIASSSPEMWQQICTTNSAPVLKLLNKYIESLQDVALHLQDDCGDISNGYIYKMFEESREYRNSIDERRVGTIKPNYRIHCDLIDEEGAIANVATILATRHINIKNIGIIHNREYEEGALKIEFYDSASRENAIDALKTHHYRVYDK